MPPRLTPLASALALALALALCGTAAAVAPSRIDFTVAPAWKGWTRLGRTTEIGIRVFTDTPTPATLDVVAGRQAVRADVNLEPGRVVHLHVPVNAADSVAVSAGAPAAPAERRDVGLALSESPLLGVGVATDELVLLEGFHTIALGANDLPRNALAYSSVDALVLDAPTLAALDLEQLGALLAHAAECGRIVLVSAEPEVRRLLDGVGGCGGRVLMHAASAAAAMEVLHSSLAADTAAAHPNAAVGDLVSLGDASWNRVLVAVAAYFAVAAVALMFFSSLPVLILMPALAAVAMLALLHAMQPAPQLVVWSEGESGARSARYQAWQRFPGLVRGHARVPVLPQLASARACDPNRPMRFEFDVHRQHAAFAEFDTRLFGQVALCYSGSLPLARTIAIGVRPDGAFDVRNAGKNAWPDGRLLAGDLVHELPALGPGQSAIVRSQSGTPLRDAGVRAAIARIPAGGAAALWELDRGLVPDTPAQSMGWLLVSLSR